MQISDTEIKKLLVQGGLRLTEPAELEEPSPRPTDGPLIKAVTADVMQMEDREDRVAELKARIESGNYAPTGQEIADAMMRRAIADRVRA